MSDFSRLEQKLSKLAEKSGRGAGPRSLGGGSPEQLLARIVGEVDEIILPRSVTFSTGSDKVTFAVANRRLQALISSSVTAEASDLVGHALGVGDEESLLRLKTALLEFLENVTSVEVEAKRPGSDATFPGESGVPATALGRAWEISLDDEPAERDPVEGLSAFLEASGGDATAWLRVDGEEVSGQGGAEDHIQGLSDAFGELLDSYLQKRDALGLQNALPVALALGGDEAGLLMLDHGEARAIVSVPHDALASFVTSWENAVRG